MTKSMMRDNSNEGEKHTESDAFEAHYEEIDPSLLGETNSLCVVVPYTTPDLTRTALRHAAASTDLGIHVCLIDLEVIPFPEDEPPIGELSERHLDSLLKESGVPGKGVVLYTTNWFEGFKKILHPESLVILAAKKSWWPAREKKLARALTKAGHQVVLLGA